MKIAVIGSQGRMGDLFCGEWRKSHEVREVDRRIGPDGKLALATEDLVRAVTGSDVVLLCVPAPAMTEVVSQVAPLMLTDQVLADICSVKILPMRTMEEKYRGPVVGTHPFFGPANNRQGARVAVVRGSRATDAHVSLLDTLFRDLGCVTFATSAATHDRHAAVSQSLHFAFSAAYFAMVNGQEGIEPYLTPSFKRYMNAARKELTVNAPMFCEFTGENPVFPDVLAEVSAMLAASGGDLRDLAAQAGEWYARYVPGE